MTGEACGQCGLPMRRRRGRDDWRKQPGDDGRVVHHAKGLCHRCYATVHHPYVARRERAKQPIRRAPHRPVRALPTDTWPGRP